jgi:prepilin peptidase CpaA
VAYALHIVVVLAFAAMLLWAAGEDVRRLTIENWVSLSIVGLYPIHVLASPVPVNWLMSVTIAAGTFAVGFALFARKLFGGGDVKLLTATALWAGPSLFPSFIFLMSIAGGVIAGVMLLNRWRAAPAGGDETGRKAGPAVMPYGVAIAVGGLMVAGTLLSEAKL